MGTSLYHGSMNTALIDHIDLNKAKTGPSNSEYGIGFYTAMNQGVAMGNAGWRGGTAGWVYEFEIKGTFDNYSKGHQQGWVAGFQEVDAPLMKQVTDAMKKLGGDFAKEGAELMASFEAGKMSEHTGRHLVKNLQSKFGVMRENDGGKLTSTDIFIEAGIDGLRANGGEFYVFINPKALPQPLPHSFEDPNNANATAVGRLLREVSVIKEIDEYNRDASAVKMNPRLNRDLRFAIAGAIEDTLKGDPAAHEKILSIRTVLEESGVPLSKNLLSQLEQAEGATAKIAGISPEQVTMRKEAEALVKDKPAREKGEGFNDYKSRVYAWHEQTNPDATAGQKDAFTTALFEKLYRDTQRAFSARTGDALAIDNDPAKLERMLRQETPSKDMSAIQYIEYDLDTLNSAPGFKLSAASPAASEIKQKPAPVALKA